MSHMRHVSVWFIAGLLIDIPSYLSCPFSLDFSYPERQRHSTDQTQGTQHTFLEKFETIRQLASRFCSSHDPPALFLSSGANDDVSVRLPCSHSIGRVDG